MKTGIGVDKGKIEKNQNVNGLNPWNVCVRLTSLVNIQGG